MLWTVQEPPGEPAAQDPAQSLIDAYSQALGLDDMVPASDGLIGA